MPPKRRSTGATAKSTNQSTLAFHGASNKVTKPSARATNAKKNLLEKSAKYETPEVVDLKVKEEEKPTTTAEAAIIEQTEQVQEQSQAQSTPEEDEARLVKPKQLQAYWKRQNVGSAPRYHQDDLGLEEKILRKFDMTGQFGPCVGIPRVKRWKRAHRLGLQPPIEVLAVLLQQQDGKDKISLQRSIMDEILNSRSELEA